MAFFLFRQTPRVPSITLYRSVLKQNYWHSAGLFQWEAGVIVRVWVASVWHHCSLLIGGLYNPTTETRLDSRAANGQLKVTIAWQHGSETTWDRHMLANTGRQGQISFHYPQEVSGKETLQYMWGAMYNNQVSRVMKSAHLSGVVYIYPGQPSTTHSWQIYHVVQYREHYLLSITPLWTVDTVGALLSVGH